MRNKYTLMKILLLVFIIFLITKPVFAQDGSEGDIEWSSLLESIGLFIVELFEKSADMMRKGIDVLSSGLEE